MSKLGNMNLGIFLQLTSIGLTTAASLAAVGSQVVDPDKKVSDIKLIPKKKKDPEQIEDGRTE